MHTVHVEELSATRAGLQVFQLSSTHNRIKLPAAGNSVLAISS